MAQYLRKRELPRLPSHLSRHDFADIGYRYCNSTKPGATSLAVSSQAPWRPAFGEPIRHSCWPLPGKQVTRFEPTIRPPRRHVTLPVPGGSSHTCTIDADRVDDMSGASCPVRKPI